MKLIFAGAFSLLLPLFIFAQPPVQKDSYDYILRQIDLHQGTPKVWDYLNAYRDKAKAENNPVEITEAYREMLHECDEALCLKYTDSMIMTAEQSGIDDLIGSSYLTKGIVYFQRRQHKRALDNYIVANEHLLGSNDLYLVNKVKYSIAQIKYYLGYYNEAISLFRECAAYFKDEDPLPYLKSLHSLALSYASVDSVALAGQANRLTLEESARLGIKDMLPYIENTSGIISYKAGRYNDAVKSIGYALEGIKRDNDFANEAIAQLFIGKAYWKLGKRDSAIIHFRQVDNIFMNEKYMRPDLRENYEYLIKYYHEMEMPDTELQYINQLLKADSVLSRDFRYLVKKIHKEYDTAELLAEKKKIEDDLKQSKWSGIVFKSAAVLLAFAVLYLAWRHLRLKRLHRQRFEELVKGNIEASEATVGGPAPLPDINPAIVEQILARLVNFENKKGFLKKDLTVGKLAESFDTNYKYLSRVIRSHRDKSFVNYINDLRVDYIIKRLKNEHLLRNYTNGALADEAGFSTAQHFVTAFKKRAKLSPGYFVGKLNNLQNEASKGV